MCATGYASAQQLASRDAPGKASATPIPCFCQSTNPALILGERDQCSTKRKRVKNRLHSLVYREFSTHPRSSRHAATALTALRQPTTTGARRRRTKRKLAACRSEGSRDTELLFQIDAVALWTCGTFLPSHKQLEIVTTLLTGILIDRHVIASHLPSGLTHAF